MADQAKPDAAAAAGAPAEQLQKLILDEATGDMVSKSEFKKREKKRQNDAKKV